LKIVLAGQVLSSAAAPCLGCPFQTISHMMAKLLKHRAICLELRAGAADALRCRIAWAFTFAVAAYNLVRLPKLIAEVD
jgi:hypothetical protein